MADTKDPKLALFELHLATAEKVSDRRAQANAWMLSVNSAIVGLYGYLGSDKLSVSAGQKAIWLWIIPASGAIVCLAWIALLTSYQKLNSAKFAVLLQLEVELPFQAFARERAAYKADKRIMLSRVERWIPYCFFCCIYSYSVLLFLKDCYEPNNYCFLLVLTLAGAEAVGEREGHRSVVGPITSGEVEGAASGHFGMKRLAVPFSELQGGADGVAGGKTEEGTAGVVEDGRGE